MKKIIALSVCSILFLGSFVSYLISSESGQTAGYSGEPGGDTCVSCHNSFALNSGGGTPKIFTNIPPQGYTPGQTYTITTRMVEQGVTKFGFQATVFGDNSNMGEGTIQVTNPSTTRLFTGPLANYVSHTITGTFSPDSLSWSFDWVAPAAGTESVTIYAAFVAANDGGTNKDDDVYSTTFQVSEASGQVGEVKAFLSGFYNEGASNMSNTLQTNGLLPSAQPYNMDPFNYNGAESIQTSRTDLTDWVLLEVRDSQNPQSILQRQAVLMTQSGQLIASNGNTNLLFPNLSNGSYYLAIRHKSHLGVISSVPIPLGPTTPVSYDYTISVNQALGNEQLAPLPNSNSVGLFVGDFDNNGLINNLDFNLWKGNSAAVNVYLPIDADGNGIVNNQDFNEWAANPSKVGNSDL